MISTRLCVPMLMIGFFSGNVFGQSQPSQLTDILKRAGERVQHYTGNILSVVCTEVTRQQELEQDLKTAKKKASELEYDFIILAATRTESIREMRKLKLINGKPPAKNVRPIAPDPTAYTTSIVMLSPENQTNFVFSDAGTGDLDGREVLIVDFVPAKLQPPSVTWKGGSFGLRFQNKGRIWIDPISYDVLRLDTHLLEPFEFKSPRVIRRGLFVRFGPSRKLKVESWDVSIRFRPTSLQDLPQPLPLPESAESLRVIQGSRVPRLRTIHSFTNYRRFASEIKIAQ